MYANTNAQNGCELILCVNVNLTVTVTVTQTQTQTSSVNIPLFDIVLDLALDMMYHQSCKPVNDVGKGA